MSLRWRLPHFSQLSLTFCVSFRVSFIIDTHQFFLHKLMHENKWLYRNFHSHHHRLYVPYAFGALYNHWLEGLLLDSLGAALAEAATGMTVRQTVLLFGFASAKTVDDHSGYMLWWDPLQMLFSNNADYHDIHHQSFGIKNNFSCVSPPPLLFSTFCALLTDVPVPLSGNPSSPAGTGCSTRS